MAEVVLRVLDLPGAPREVLERLRANDPDEFETFAMTVAGAYLMNPRVRQKLGLPVGPPEANPPFPDLPGLPRERRSEMRRGRRLRDFLVASRPARPHIWRFGVIAAPASPFGSIAPDLCR